MLIATGGTIGFVKRGSVASLIAGGGSGLALGYGVRRQTVDRRDVGVIVGELQGWEGAELSGGLDERRADEVVLQLCRSSCWW